MATVQVVRPIVARLAMGGGLGAIAGLVQLAAAIPTLSGVDTGDRGYYVKVMAALALLCGTALASVSVCLAVLRIRNWFTAAVGLCLAEAIVGGAIWHGIGGNGHVGRFGLIVVLVIVEVTLAAAFLPRRPGLEDGSRPVRPRG